MWGKSKAHLINYQLHPYNQQKKKKLGYSFVKARFTLAAAVGRLQIFAVVQPKRARFTLPSNFVRLQAHKRKNPFNQIINSIDQWFSIFCGFWPPSINSQHQWLPVERFLGGFSIGRHYHLDGGTLLFVKYTIGKKNKECQWSPG